MRSLALGPIIGLLLAVSAAAQTNTANGNTIRSEITPGNGGTPEQHVYIINNSSQTIIVTSIRLVECENVQGSCATRRMKNRIGPGSRTSVHTVRPRFPDQGFGFQITFTWQVEGEESPTAEDIAKDDKAFEIDTVIVKPKLLDVKVGETVDLSQALSITAKNAKGKPFKEVYFMTRLILGEDFVSLDGSKLTGRAAGTAAVLISASVVATPNPNPKGATQVVITVVP